MDNIDALLESIHSDCREYDDVYGLPLLDSTTRENLRESVETYSRKLLWQFVDFYDKKRWDSISELFDEFIEENNLKAKR